MISASSWFMILVALAALLLAAAREPRYYYMPRGETYSWDRSFPQGCSCVDDSAFTECDLFKCTCACDLTAGKCDYNCCCDQDCTIDQTSRFKNTEGGCSLQRYSPNNVQYCYSDSELARINHRDVIKETDVAEAAVTDALCVESVNLYYEGEFYDNAATQGASVFSTSKGTKDYTYTDTYDYYIMDEYFDQNDTIPAFVRTSNDSTTLYNAGYLQVPQADFSGYCNDMTLGTFENDIPGPFAAAFDDDGFINIASKDRGGQCVREFSIDNGTFIEQCEDEQSIARYVTELYVGATADAVEETGLTTSSSSVVSVNLATVRYLDPTTGEYSSVTRRASTPGGDVICPTKAFNDSSSYAAYNTDCVFASSPSTNFPMCMNVIKSVRYVVTNSQDEFGTISAVDAHVVVTDISLDWTESAARVSDNTVMQSFMLTFTDVGDGTVSKSRGNKAARSRSGNPGYIMGAPLLWGESNSTYADVVNQLVAGFMLPSAVSLVGDEPTSSIRAGGNCPTINDETASTGVSFGYDTQTGCTVELTLDELEAVCCYQNPNCGSDDGVYTTDHVDNSGIPPFLNNNFTEAGYVGIYGNADPLDVSQWLYVSAPAESDKRTWSSATKTCSDMYTGVLYEFLVARTGEKTWPQNKVIAGKASYVQEDWQWMGGVKSGSRKQKFVLSASASFIHKSDQELQGYTPPPPPIIFRMPYDTFYPFDVRNAGSRSTPSSWVLLGFVGAVSAALSMASLR